MKESVAENEEETDEAEDAEESKEFEYAFSSVSSASSASSVSSQSPQHLIQSPLLDRLLDIARDAAPRAHGSLYRSAV